MKFEQLVRINFDQRITVDNHERIALDQCGRMLDSACRSHRERLMRNHYFIGMPYTGVSLSDMLAQVASTQNNACTSVNDKVLKNEIEKRSVMN